jgi:hypothetical protein
VGQVSVWHPSLNASDRQHRFPRNIEHVAAERETDHRVIGQAELAAADEGDLLMRSPPGKNADTRAKPSWKGSETVSVNTIGETPSSLLKPSRSQRTLT